MVILAGVAWTVGEDTSGVGDRREVETHISDDTESGSLAEVDLGDALGCSCSSLIDCEQEIGNGWEGSCWSTVINDEQPALTYNRSCGVGDITSDMEVNHLDSVSNTVPVSGSSLDAIQQGDIGSSRWRPEQIG